MKRTLYSILFLSIMGLPAVLTAQTSETVPYQYSHDEAPYTYLSENAEQLLGNTGWDDEIVPFTLPFEFKYQGETVTSWLMDTYGGLYPNEFNMGQDIPGILGIFCDYTDNGNSSINLETTGEAGSRIAKIEFRNVGFWSSEPLTDSANFQIWLYEGSNKIEYHVGPNHVDSFLFVIDEMVLVVGLDYYMPNDSVFLHTVNYNDNTNTDTVLRYYINEEEDPPAELLEAIMYGNHYPQEGTVFRFDPSSTDDTVGIKDMPRLISSVSPNPTSDLLTLKLLHTPAPDATLSMYPISGKKLMQQPVTDKVSRVDLTGLASGIYLLRYSERGLSQTIRIIKR